MNFGFLFSEATGDARPRRHCQHVGRFRRRERCVTGQEAIEGVGVAGELKGVCLIDPVSGDAMGIIGQCNSAGWPAHLRHDRIGGNIHA